MDISRDIQQKRLGFVPQKENIYNLLLHNGDDTDKESLALLKDIKENLERTVVLNIWQRNGAPLWCLRLSRYIEVYDLRFSEEYHVAFVKILYYALTNFRQELYFVKILIDTLTLLLRKLKLLSPKNITLPWRPMYDLCNDLFFTKNINFEDMHPVRFLKLKAHKLVHLTNNYFPISSTQEIIDLLFPQLCPFDKGGMDRALKKLEWFLPTNETTYDKWLPVLMDLWNACSNEAGWEDIFMALIARLAKNHIGLIDWENYNAVIYSRIIRTMNIPISYSKTVTKNQYHMSIEFCAVWIVSSFDNEGSSHAMFNKFLSLLESYCHPSNFGRWSKWIYEMISWLSKCLINRLNYENQERLTWQKPVPACKKLQDDYLISYVKGLLNIVMIAVSAESERSFLMKTLYNLAVLKPEIVIPRVLDLLQKSLLHPTEPKMFLSALDCVITVAQPLAEGAINGYPEGPTHIFEILFMCLSGIDPSHLLKTYKSLMCIDRLLSMIPLAFTKEIPENEELNSYEEKILSDYQKLDVFLLLLLDKYLLLISDPQFSQNSDLEAVFNVFRSDKWEKFKDLIHSLVPRMSLAMFLECLSKIKVFIFSRILDGKSGRAAAVICGIMAKAYPEEVLNCFLPKLVSIIQPMITVSGEIEEESLEEELIYYLVLCSEIVSCNSTTLSKYSDEICEILDSALNSNSRKIVKLAAEILTNVFISLTTLSNKNSYYLYERNVCPIKDFGILRKVSDLNVQWNVPNDDNVKAVHLFINKYIIPSVKYIDELLNGTVTLERENLAKRLMIIEAGLESCHLLSLHGDVEEVLVDNSRFYFDNGLTGFITMLDGSSLYDYVLPTITKLQDYLLSFAEDDTRSLNLIINIWTLFLRIPKSPMSIKEEFNSLKKCMNNRLQKKYLGKHISYHLKKLELLQAMRLYCSDLIITKLHVNILEKIVSLCVCKYRTVRVEAQILMDKVFDRTPNLPRLIIPIASKLLKKNDISSTTYKGTLMMLFHSSKPLISEHHLDLYMEILPLLVTTAPDDEQSSSIILLERIEKIMQESFPKLILMSNIPEYPSEATDLLSASLLRLQMSKEDHCSLPVKNNEIKQSWITFELNQQQRLEQYYSVINALVKSMTETKLHWRQQRLGLVLIYVLGIRNIKYPPSLISYILETLLHDNLHLRNVALKVFKLILHQQKVDYEKLNVKLCQLFGEYKQDDGFGERPENTICKFDLSCNITTQEDWDRNFFVDSSVGYAPWPKLVEMFVAHPELSTTEEMVDNVLSHIILFFKNCENVKKLMQLLKIEDSVYLKSFNRNIAKTFKMLFRNCGDAFIEHFRLELYELAGDSQERSQILVMEVLAGIIKGSKHWSFISQQSIWCWIKDVLYLILKQLPSEKLEAWKLFLYYITSKNHPKRMFWLYKQLHNDIKNNVDTSLFYARKLLSMEYLIWQHQWQVEEINRNLLPILLSLSSSDYDLIRERVAGLLVQIYMPDIGYKSVRDTYSPRVKHFITDSITKLETGLRCTNSQLLKSNNTELFETDSNIETILQPISGFGYESAKNLLKTISIWIKDGSFNFIGIKPEIYNFLPLLIMMENDVDLEISYACKNAIAHLAEKLILPCHFPFVLEAIIKASNNELWRAKISILQFIEVISLHNIAIVGSNEEWLKTLMMIILAFLKDEKYEVRQKAGEALSGFIHCDIVNNKTNLLIKFEQMCNKECTRKKHAGIIGLCAFLNASPYYYNEILTTVFQLLIKHFRDTTAVTNTIKITIREFIRTHYYDWNDIKEILHAEDVDIDELIIPPDHYV